MDIKDLEAKRLKTIISGMKNKGFKTTQISLNIIMNFVIVLVIFTIPYLIASFIGEYTSIATIELILYTTGSCIGFWLLQFVWNKLFKDEYSLVKDLRDAKPISKQHFIQKHLGNIVYCAIIVITGVISGNFILVSIGSYLMAFDYPYLFIMVLFSKTGKDAFLVNYPTSLRGALIFEPIDEK